MLFDTAKWRQHDITSKLLRWMNVQKEGAERIYRLGSLPPFLLVFSGNVKVTYQLDLVEAPQSSLFSRHCHSRLLILLYGNICI